VKTEMQPAIMQVCLTALKEKLRDQEEAANLTRAAIKVVEQMLREATEEIKEEA
jgi:hypothetical protein